MESTVNPNRYIPPCMNGHYDYMENGNCEVFYTTTNENSGNKFYAIAFMGKGKNSVWYYQFLTEEKMEKRIAEFIDSCKSIVSNKIERKAKQKEANDNAKVNVGDIFKYSYGYDQTNIEYYQVVTVKGKTATLHRIGSKSVPNTQGFMCEYVKPVKDNFITTNYGEDVITKRIQAGYKGQPCFSMSFGSLSLTSENEQAYSSWYA